MRGSVSRCITTVLIVLLHVSTQVPRGMIFCIHSSIIRVASCHSEVTCRER